MRQNHGTPHHLPVHSCDLGSLDSGAIALRIHFSAPSGEGNASQRVTAIFSLSEELASNFSETLAEMLEIKRLNN